MQSKRPRVNVLIIGGTRFLGRHIVDELLRRGHTPTLFNTGNHRDGAPSSVEQIHGDRSRDLARIGDRQWDCVIDTCGFLPAQAEISCRYFDGRTKQYVFVSSVSAIDLTQANPTEDTRVLTMPEGASRTQMVPETYGALKALCERIVVSRFRSGALIVRPGLIVGPYDPTDRFTYWPMRVARGGRILAPAGPEYPVQFIDARDLAAWIVLQTERRRGGTFNLTGPPGRVTLGDVLQTSARVANTQPEILWADEAFLERHDVGEWIDLPLWISQKSSLPGMSSLNVTRAIGAGLKIRPLEHTIRDTWRWAAGRAKNYAWRAGLTPEREAELLQKIG